MVFPMYMGVIPPKEEQVGARLGIPHVYGGDPTHCNSREVIW